MRLPTISRKYYVILAAIIIAAVIISAVMLSLWSVKTINAYFSPTNKVAPGQSTNLTAEITNTVGKDVNSYDVIVRAINENITIGAFSQPQGTFGMNELRKITVPVSLSADMLDGTYSIEVDVNLGGVPFSTRVNLEVKK